MVCINGVKKERRWNFSRIGIGEVEEYKYIGVIVKAGLNNNNNIIYLKYNIQCSVGYITKCIYNNQQ